jgi:hypothetical protein
MLIEELKELDELYDSAKERLDNSTKYATRSSPVFISNQTSNLISIREKKLNIIKELSNIKKSKMDIEMKVFNTNNKIDDNDTSTSEEVLALYKLLHSTDRKELIKQAEESSNKIGDVNTNEVIDDIDDISFDELVKERLEENKEEIIKEHIKIDLPKGYSIVCTSNSELYIVDNDYNIIENNKKIKVDLNSIKIVEFIKENDEDYAIDVDGNKYEVVEIE